MICTNNMFISNTFSIMVYAIYTIRKKLGYRILDYICIQCYFLRYLLAVVFALAPKICECLYQEVVFPILGDRYVISAITLCYKICTYNNEFNQINFFELNGTESNISLM